MIGPMPFRTFALPLLAAVGIFIPAALAADEGTYQLQTGDVVFQCTGGEQAKAIREATGKADRATLFVTS